MKYIAKMGNLKIASDVASILRSGGDVELGYLRNDWKLCNDCINELNNLRIYAEWNMRTGWSDAGCFWY
jgi:hypothetical protein